MSHPPVALVFHPSLLAKELSGSLIEEPEGFGGKADPGGVIDRDGPVARYRRLDKPAAQTQIQHAPCSEMLDPGHLGGVRGLGAEGARYPNLLRPHAERDLLRQTLELRKLADSGRIHPKPRPDQHR